MEQDTAVVNTVQRSSKQNLRSRKLSASWEDTNTMESDDLDINSKTLYNAVVNNDVTKVMGLLERNVDVNWVNPEDKCKTALHIATQSASTLLVALLLGKGAEVHKRDADGNSPLNIAVSEHPDNNELVNLLANKTVSALEESKRQIKQNKQLILALQSGTAATEEVIAYFNRSKANTVSGTAISTQLDQIFEPHKNASIFQSHFARNSAIIEMLKISHFQTIYNIFVAVLLIAFVNTLLYNYYESGTILDFELLVWCFADFPFAAMLWCGLFCYSFIAFLLQRAIVMQSIAPRAAYTAYAGAQMAMYIIIPILVRLRGLPPASAAVVLCELVRLSMKMHSYLMVNMSLRLAKQNKDPDPNVADYPENVTAEDYFLFLWFPTLVYQTSYPRTANIRLSFVVKRMAETFLCTLYTYAIFVRYCVPHYHEMTGSTKELLFSTFKVMLPGIAVSLLAFYGVLHSWLNAFAEITRFADRQFYSDWWNATSWGTYYRKWNYVVHKFLHRHIFMDCLLVHKMSKGLSMWITFIISAIVHEYVIAICLGFYKPVMLIMFLLPGVFFIYLTKIMRGSRMWNIFMWAMLIIGHGMLVSLYSRAWYFHYHVDRPFSWYNYFSLL